MSELNIPTYSSDLKYSSDGIWHASKAENISYPDQGNQNCFAVEDNSFWFAHRNQCIEELVRIVPPPQNTLFDIGGGNGFVAAGLAKAGVEVVLIEPGPTGAANAKKRGLKNVVCATTEQANFRLGSIPSVGLFDVIEHIECDVEFLKNLYPLMQTGGLVYFTVPAYSALWSSEDEYAGHFRRYNRHTLHKLVTDAGFQVVYSSYFFRFLILPVFLLRALPYKLGIAPKPSKNIARDHGSNNESFLKQWIRKILSYEITNIKNHKSMSFGASLILVARKHT